jgi:hypothetical protein
MYVQLHTRANSAARGEVLAVLGQVTQTAAIPARPAARNAVASRVIADGLPGTSPTSPAASLIAGRSDGSIAVSDGFAPYFTAFSGCEI